MEKKLKRSLNQYEVDIVEHPRICLVCQEGKNQGILRNCRDCFCVAFCKICVEKNKKNPIKAIMRHKEKYCKALRTAAEDYKNEVNLGHQVIQYQPKIVKKYQMLEGDIEDFFRADVGNLVSNKLEGYQESELRYLTFMYTCPLTVLFGLQAEGLFENPIDKISDLTIHLVGVRRAELRHVTGWEVIPSRLPNLKRLKLVFIGDESPTPKDFPKEFTYKSKDLQAERPGLEVRYFFEPPGFYQDYFQSNRFVKPDLVVALDCGFKFYPAWIPAIRIVLEKIKCSLLFTEFNNPDQNDNLDLVRANCGNDVRVVLEPQPNPFCSRRPVRCSDKTGNYEPFSVIYTNDYICAVRPK